MHPHIKRFSNAFIENYISTQHYTDHYRRMPNKKFRRLIFERFQQITYIHIYLSIHLSIYIYIGPQSGLLGKSCRVSTLFGESRQTSQVNYSVFHHVSGNVLICYTHVYMYIYMYMVRQNFSTCLSGLPSFSFEQVMERSEVKKERGQMPLLTSF